MSHTFKKTKKRMGHHLNKYVFRKGRKKDKSTDDSQGSCNCVYFHSIPNCWRIPLWRFTDLSRRDSLEDGVHPRQSEFVVLKERKLVQIKQLKIGIQRFSTMMEMCGPGSIPDANLMSAIFDLVRTNNYIYL